MTSQFKSIKDIDCRVVREKDDQVSVLLYFPQEQLAQMFSDMLDEPVENVRGWLAREHTPLSLADVERLSMVLDKALEVANMIRDAQNYSITVQDADCECVEVFE